MATEDPLQRVMDITSNAIKEMGDTFNSRLNSLGDFVNTSFEKTRNVVNEQKNQFSEIILKQQEVINSLILKCGDLEALNMFLFSVIASSNTEIYATIVENVKTSLDKLSEETDNERDFAQMLRNVMGIKPDEKPHLRLVRSVTVPPSDDSSTQ